MSREGGSVAVLAAAATLLFLLALPAIADAGSFLVARSRAQAAADAAALAAVVRQVPALGQTGSPQDAAREEAERNGARLVECLCERNQARATVTVEIFPRTLLAPWRGRAVRAVASATVDDYVLTYRSG